MAIGLVDEIVKNSKGTLVKTVVALVLKEVVVDKSRQQLILEEVEE